MLIAFKTLCMSDLCRRVGGVSERMVSLTPKTLEQDGSMIRHSHNTVPPRVEDRLSGLGIGITRHVKALAVWIETHLPVAKP